MMGRVSLWKHFYDLQKMGWILLLATVALATVPTASAWAQLRTGRSERAIYKAGNFSHSASQSTENRTSQPERTRRSNARGVSDRPIHVDFDQSEVVRASGQSSILDKNRRTTSTQAQTESNKAHPPAEKASPSVPAVDAHADTHSTVDSSKLSIPEPEYVPNHGPEEMHEFVSGNCDELACLAPTCAAGGCCIGDGPLAHLLSRLSVRAEVPLFWRRAMGIPPLVTTSPTGTDAGIAGELGQSTTRTLLGNGLIDEDLNAGFRITLGTWFGHDCYRGVLFRYWNAGDQDNEFNFTSDQFPILARPFNNVTGTAAQDTQLIAFPGESNGSIRVNTTSQVDGLDIALRRLAYQDRFTRLDWLVGYQRAKVDESLSILSSTNITGSVPGLQGSSISVRDTFATENEFNGFMLGIMGTRRLGCWSYESKFRLGMGNLRREVNLTGTTTTTSAQGAVATESLGLLVRNTNNNPFTDDTFVVVPEVGLDIGYQLTSTLDFIVGYNYLLIPKVAQPGEQIDPNLSVNLSDPLTGALRPQLSFDERRYWVHSLNLGLQWRY